MKLIFIIFSLAMIVTRFPFGGGALHLLDISWALFFLLGRLSLERHVKLISFTWFVLLGWIIDLIATQGAVVSSYCMTPAYLGMPLAYGALTFIGAASSKIKVKQESLAALIVVLSVAVGTLAAFMISNVFFFQFSGYFEQMTLLSYSSAVAHYFVPFLMTAQLYVLGWFCLDRYCALEDKVIHSFKGAAHE